MRLVMLHRIPCCGGCRCWFVLYTCVWHTVACAVIRQDQGVCTVGCLTSNLLAMCVLALTGPYLSRCCVMVHGAIGSFESAFGGSGCMCACGAVPQCTGNRGAGKQFGCEYIWHVGSHVLQYCLTSCNGTHHSCRALDKGLIPCAASAVVDVYIPFFCWHSPCRCQAYVIAKPICALQKEMAGTIEGGAGASCWRLFKVLPAEVVCQASRGAFFADIASSV